MINIRGYNYTADDGRIAKDFFTGEWDLKDNMETGFINLKPDGSCEVVYFVSTPDSETRINQCPEGVDIHENYGYILDGSYTNWTEFPDTGDFFAPPIAVKYASSLREVKHNIFMEEFKTPVVSKEVWNKINPTTVDKKGNKHTLNTYVLTEGKPYTFGVELEVSSGIVPSYERNKFLMHCIRDGSINGLRRGGPEFVTGVLRGDQGIMHLQDICAQLSKRSILNSSCGLHVHVGNMNFSRLEIVCAYKLGRMLQSELWSIQPPSRRNNEYCKQLPALSDFVKIKKKDTQTPEEFKINLHKTHDELFEIIAGTAAGRHANKLTDHPRGAHCGYDRSTMRYCWLNFVPSMFNIRGQSREEPSTTSVGSGAMSFVRGADGRWTTATNAPTVTEPHRVIKVKPKSYTFEFRLHYGTVDFKTTLMWLLICMAFCNFVENHQYEILSRSSITLEEVIKTTFPKSAKTILAHVEARRAKFNRPGFAEEGIYVNPLYGTNVIPTELKTLIKEIQETNDVHNQRSTTGNRQGLVILD